MEKNNSKVLIIIVIILGILVLGLTGFIVYRELSYTNNVDCPTTDESDVNSDLAIKNVNDFSKENGKELNVYNLYDYVPKYEDLKVGNESTFKIGDVEFSYVTSRGEYDEEIEGYPTELTVKYNGVSIITLDYKYDNPNVILAEDFVILQIGTGEMYDGPIKVFDKYGNVVKTVSSTYKEILDRGTDCDEGVRVNTTMKVINGKLYFSEAQVNLGGVPSVLIKYVDLKDYFKEYVIQEYQLLCDQE